MTMPNKKSATQAASLSASGAKANNPVPPDDLINRGSRVMDAEVGHDMELHDLPGARFPGRVCFPMRRSRTGGWIRRHTPISMSKREPLRCVSSPSRYFDRWRRAGAARRAQPHPRCRRAGHPRANRAARRTGTSRNISSASRTATTDVEFVSVDHWDRGALAFPLVYARTALPRRRDRGMMNAQEPSGKPGRAPLSVGNGPVLQLGRRKLTG